jgi:hypothetical protein
MEKLLMRLSRFLRYNLHWQPNAFQSVVYYRPFSPTACQIKEDQMSAIQSNLSSTGFDYVVAVTQDSINATLEQYLYYSGLPEVVLCYVYDTNNNPTPIDFTKFVASAKSTDPFTVPNSTPSTDQRVQNLNNANFAFAIKAKLGLPPGVPPKNLPPIVVLKPGQSNVTYTLMFAEFVATELQFGPRGSVTWFNEAQPSGTAWTFTGAIDLDLQAASFEKLPASVQTVLKGLQNQGKTFSIQQLYYDLNSSDLEQGFTFNNLPSNSALSTFMTADFINTYWKALGGASVLGYGANQTSATSPQSLAVTNLNFFTPGAVGNQGAPLTLNYLCATNNDPLPATTHAGFGWNWIEPGEISQYNGVAALNRNTLARFYAQQLRGYVQSNCYSPAGKIRVWLSGALDTTVNYQWGLTAGQTPSVTFPPAGAVVLTYSWSSPVVGDQAGLNGDMGKLQMSSSFNLSVSFQSNATVVIVQHLVININVSYLATSDGGNVVDKQITDTYAIGVDGSGEIVATLQSSVPVDHSVTPSANGFLNFWANVEQISNSVTQWAQSIFGTRVTDIPASAIRNFVFPGGNTFAFANVQFSNNQDLVSHITYADQAAPRLAKAQNR